MNKTREELERIDAEIIQQRKPYISSGLTVAEWKQVFADAHAVRMTARKNAMAAMEAAFANQNI